MLRISAQSLHDIKSPFLTFVRGNLSAEALKPLPPENFQPGGHMVFVSKPEQLPLIQEKIPGIIIAADKMDQSKISLQSNQALFSTPSIQAAMATILPFFDQRLQFLKPGIDPKAYVDPAARIGHNVIVSAQCYVGPEAVIGDGAVLMPGVIVEAKARVGAKTLLYPHVVIGFDCQVGQNCIIHANTSVGSDGYGFVTDPQTKIHHKVPQVGNVVIEDRVEIGANCAIDRATLASTRIGAGTKFDNLVHIAHNTIIGKNCLMAAGFMTAGSVVIGDNFTAGGGVHIKDHVHITDNVSLGGRTGVMQDITEPGVYVGYPAEPLREGMKTLANLKYVPSLKRQMTSVMKHLGLDTEA